MYDSTPLCCKEIFGKVRAWYYQAISILGAMARPVLVCAYSDLSLAITLLLILLSQKQVQVSESAEEAIPYTVAQHPCDY